MIIYKSIKHLNGRSKVTHTSYATLKCRGEQKPVTQIGPVLFSKSCWVQNRVGSSLGVHSFEPSPGSLFLFFLYFQYINNLKYLFEKFSKKKFGHVWARLAR